MNRYPIWPFSAFWVRHQHAEIDVADVPRLPHELNPYERLWVRFAFADLKGVALIAAGAAFGSLPFFLSPMWVLICACVAGLGIGILVDVFSHRSDA